MSLKSTNCERQLAALLWAPDIHSKEMLYVLNSSDHLFTVLFAFLPFRSFVVSDPCRQQFHFVTA